MIITKITRVIKFILDTSICFVENNIDEYNKMKTVL